MTLHLLEVGIQWPPETFLRNKLEGLAARGMRVTVASNLVLDPDAAVPGVELLAISRERRWLWNAVAVGLRSPRRLVRLVREIRRVPPALLRRHGSRRRLLALCLPLARTRPDVVQFEWNVAAVDLFPMFGLWRCPIVTSCRGSDLTVYPHVPVLRAYADRLPEVIRRADAVHCVSEELKREAEPFGLEPARARVIRPAVDPEAFSADGPRRRPAGDELRVVMVGALRWEKGYEWALEAIRRLVDRGVPARLEIIGGDPPGLAFSAGSERARIEHTVADLGLEDRVTVAGEVPHRDVRDRLAGADVLLHASVAEGIPNVVLEAMACGLPVVTTQGGVAEAVRNGVEGYLVEPRDPHQLAEALMTLWREPSRQASMGAAGRDRVKTAFALDGQIAAFATLYRELVRP